MPFDPVENTSKNDSVKGPANRPVQADVHDLRRPDPAMDDGGLALPPIPTIGSDDVDASTSGEILLPDSSSGGVGDEYVPGTPVVSGALAIIMKESALATTTVGGALDIIQQTLEKRFPDASKKICKAVVERAEALKIPAAPLVRLLEIAPTAQAAYSASRALVEIAATPETALQIHDEATKRNVGVRLITNEVLMVHAILDGIPLTRVGKRWELAPQTQESFLALGPESRENYVKVRDELSEIWRDFCDVRRRKGISFHAVARLYQASGNDEDFVRASLSAVEETRFIRSDEHRSDSIKFDALLTEVISKGSDDLDPYEFLEEYCADNDKRDSEI